MAGQRELMQRRLLRAKSIDAAERVTALETASPLLCKLLAADLNTAGDQTFPTIAATRYQPKRIVAVGKTGTTATAVVDVRTDVGGGGLALVSGQSFAALSSAVEVLEITLGALTDALLVSTLYLRVTTPEGAAGTVDLFVFGDVLE